MVQAGEGGLNHEYMGSTGAPPAAWQGPEEREESANSQFSKTPHTQNFGHPHTLLWSGSRYAVYIDQICGINGQPGPKAVKFGLMWFPEDYFPPRERPTNYHDVREKLNVTGRPHE